MTIRCAIYTRKSSEEGLEQSFNSLDNQRLAGESYVMSQSHEGWEIIQKHYDDGGYSGGNMDRPGLQELFRDIEAGLVDCVVVYKIDRLSRSLLDFAKIVELFDKHKVSFVAVTQSFNTSNSMGRLMLNVLLSFAQYERELTGERIRDKVAASKKLGYWMGGYPPLGYDIKDRSLVINKDESILVRKIFERFMDLRSITALLQEINNLGGTTKKGKRFSKMNIRKLLTNPIYKGYVRHRSAEYKGLHEGIISEKNWELVQKIFQKSERSSVYISNASILKSIIRCEHCNCKMTPTCCNKNGRKYRYYTYSNHLRTKTCESINKNIPAGEVEEFVTKAVRNLLQDPAILVRSIQNLNDANMSLEDAQKSIINMDKIWNNLYSHEQERITHLLIKHVMVNDSGINILLNNEGTQAFVREIQPCNQ